MRSAYETITKVIDVLPPCECRDRLVGLTTGVTASDDENASNLWVSASEIMMETCPGDLMGKVMAMWHEDVTPERREDVPGKIHEKPEPPMTDEAKIRILEARVKHWQARHEEMATSRAEWVEKAHGLEKYNQELVTQNEELLGAVAEAIKSNEAMQAVE